MTAQDQRLAIEQLQKGIIQHRAGQLGLAQSHYQRAAKLDPKNPSAWHLLGVAALQMDNLALAAKHLRTCIKVSPGFAEAHNNLGVALRRMGRHAESVGAFRGALAARERYVEAVYNLGLACESMGKPDEAERAYRQALSWRNNDFNCANNLGNLLRRQSRLSEALPWLDLARRLQPDSAQANGNYAMLLSDLGRHAEAVTHARIATAIEPEKSEWWQALGVAERLQKNTGPAIAALRQSIALAPDNDIALSELGVALAEDGAVEESREILSRARPNERHAERMRWTILLSLPSVYRDEAQIDFERERYARSLDSIAAGLRLDTQQQRFGAYEAICGVATFLLHYQDRNNTLLQNRFGDLVHRVLTAALPQFMQPCSWHPRARDERVRVGVVSSHLMNHTVSRYFRELLVGLDPQRFDLRVWYSGAELDFSTKQIADRSTAFEQVNEEAYATAGKIRAAELDVLIYPEIGMDPRHHVLGALRLAPVQCVLYGHPVTSGLSNMDYFVSGAALEPADASGHYREKLVLLPGLGARPEPRSTTFDGDWVDAFTQGAPLLLCLQNHLKLLPSFDAMLAEIVQRSGAKLGFFVRNEGVGRRFRERIENAFRQRRLDPDRDLIFFPAQKFEAFLGAVQRASLVLDTPWFSGGATSLDAFSVGTPVLALEGPMARGRQTSGMLRMLGLDELIATSDEDYVEKATALMRDASRRTALRETILARKSVLFEDDAPVRAFADFVERVGRGESN